jgi:AcrR family transcriptional regulator
LTNNAFCEKIIPTGRYDFWGGFMTQQRAEETHARILEAARTCFARAGYDATGVAEICKQAGVSKGAFYHHYASKHAVFLELLNDWLDGLDIEMGDSRAAGETAVEWLLSIAGMARQVFRAAEGQVPMFLQFLTQAIRDPEIWPATIAPYQRYRTFFAGLVRAGIAEGTLRPVDPDIAAQVVVSLAVGLVLQGVLDPQGGDWGRVAEEAVRMLLQGMATGDQSYNTMLMQATTSRSRGEL